MLPHLALPRRISPWYLRLHFYTNLQRSWGLPSSHTLLLRMSTPNLSFNKGELPNRWRLVDLHRSTYSDIIAGGLVTLTSQRKGRRQSFHHPRGILSYFDQWTTRIRGGSKLKTPLIFLESRNPNANQSLLLWSSLPIVSERHSDDGLILNVVVLWISLIADNWWKFNQRIGQISSTWPTELLLLLLLLPIEIWFWTEDDLLVEFRGNLKPIPTDDVIAPFWNYKCKLVMRNLGLVVLIFDTASQKWICKVSTQTLNSVQDSWWVS